MPESAAPPYITSLIRHFADLRDRTHGGSASLEDKEAHFEKGGSPGSPRNEHELTAQLRANQRDGDYEAQTMAV